MEETSLEDFATPDRAAPIEDESAAEATQPAADTERNAEEPSATGSEESDASVTTEADSEGAEAAGRPAITASWSSDGEPCTECGEVSPCRWAQAGSMVCPACKDW